MRNEGVQAVLSIERMGRKGRGKEHVIMHEKKGKLFRPNNHIHAQPKKVMTSKDAYAHLGVSSDKHEVHQATRRINKDMGLGTGTDSFCQVMRSPFRSTSPSSTDERLLLMHSDGAGTKSSLAYLYWKETNDASVFRGIAQDALVMNIDDLLCMGACKQLVFNSIIGRNARRIPQKVLQEIIEGTQAFVQELNDKYGFDSQLLGGETADIGDLVQTLVVDVTATTEIFEKNCILTQKICPGLVIVGLASYGKTRYETVYNSGIGSNGLTLARHLLLPKEMQQKYPETYDASLPSSRVYRGTQSPHTAIPGTPLTLIQALLSPTRTYLPVVKQMLQTLRPPHAMIHCTGGGQKKCLNFSRGIHYVKDNCFRLPPLYQLLSTRLNNPKELFSTFNCGHRMEVYTTQKNASDLISLCKSYQLEAQIIGYTEAAPNETNQLTIKTEATNLHFQQTFH